MMDQIREAIEQDRFTEYKKEFFENYNENP